MAELWRTERGLNFKCLHCGAIYETAPGHIPADDLGKPRCQVCGEEMDGRDSFRLPSYRLKQRPPTVTD